MSFRILETSLSQILLRDQQDIIVVGVEVGQGGDDKSNLPRSRSNVGNVEQTIFGY